MKLFVIVILSVFIACNNIPEEGSNNKAESFKLNFLDNLDTIQGWGDVGECFTYDTTNLNSSRYIFFSDLKNRYAIVKINSQVMLFQKDSVNIIRLTNKSYQEVLKGSGIRLVLNVKEIKKYDEGGLYEGILEIINNKQKKEIKVHGEGESMDELGSNTFSTQQDKTKDTCFYSLKIPDNIDMPSTRPFDTTIIKGKNCNTHILLCSECGTGANYSLFMGDSINFKNHPAPIRSCGVRGKVEKAGKMDITNLPNGTYTMLLQADCNGGVFKIHIK